MSYDVIYHDFAQLVWSFPVLRECPEDILLPRFDCMRFDAWVVSIAHDEDAVLEAGAFILNCFSTHNIYQCGEFHFFHAMGAWDIGQRTAFSRWAANPWRP